MTRSIPPLALAAAVPALLFVGMCFVAIDRHSHSASDTLTNLYPYAGVTFLLWDWLARRLAERAS